MRKRVKKQWCSMIISIMLIIINCSTALATQSKSGSFSTGYAYSDDPGTYVANIARAQLGRTGSNFGYTEDWCADFASDCAKIAGQSTAVPMNGSSTALHNAIVNAGGHDTKSPQVGDYVFVNWEGGSGIKHTEIVYKVSGSTIYTVGGNRGNASVSSTTVKTSTFQISSNLVKFITHPNYKRTSSLNLGSPANIVGMTYGVIYNKKSGRFLTVDDDGYVKLYNESGKANQLWKFVRHDDGSYTILSAKNGKALDVDISTAGDGNGLKLHVWDNANTSNQKFKFFKHGDDFIIMPNSSTTRVLDCTSGSFAEGTPIQIWETNNTDAQIWQVYFASDIALKAPSPKITVNGTKVITTWSHMYGAAGYNLKITKSSDNSTVLSKSNITSPYTATISTGGKYKLQVTSMNSFYSKASSAIEFEIIAVTDITLNKTSASMGVGETMALKALITPANAANKSITWSSSNTSVATVDSNGVVTAKMAGTSKITVKTLDGGKIATCSITVSNPTPTVKPTVTPTAKPTATPTMKPTATPTVKPTATPTAKPTATPTTKPTPTPTLTPTAKPTATPTLKPTATPEPATYMGTIRAQAVSAGTGDTVTVPVVISENPGIAGYNISINYDKTVMTPTAVKKGADFSAGTLTSNLNQGTDAEALDTVTAYWSNPSDIKSDGELFNITFKIKDTAKAGEYSVILKYSRGDITNQKLEDVTPKIVNGSVTVSDIKKGDIYEDGAVNTKDGVLLSQYLAKWDVRFSDRQMKAADVYEDGAVNTKDGVKLSQVLAKWNGVTLAEEITAMSADSLMLDVESRSAVPGGYVDIPVVAAENPGISGFNFNIEYDKSLLTPVSVTPGSILAQGSFTSNLDQGGNVSDLDFITAYWSNPSDMTETGELFTVRFKVNDGISGDIPVELTYTEGDICNQRFENISADITNGVVTVVPQDGEYPYEITAVQLKSADGEALESIPQGEPFTVDAEVFAGAEYSGSADLLVGLYGSDGQLLEAKKCAIAGSAEYAVNISGDYAEISKIKVFIWDERMTPLAQCVIAE